MDNPKKSPTVLSLCTGYGGLEKGIEAVIGKCTTLAYVEIEAFAITNLVNKMETGKLDSVPIWTDLKTFDAKPFRGTVDILTGGYPCQPFSAAGKRNGTDDHRHLWPYIRTIVMDCKPRQCFFENVEGHLTPGISEVLEDLEAMGYRSEVGIFSAAEVGAPHQRKRVFILAKSDGSGIWGNNRPPRSEAGAKILRQRDRKERSIWIDSTGADSELADSEQQGLQGAGFEKPEWWCKSPSFPGNWNSNPWPSSPGEPQHEWEEPRTIMDNSTGRRYRNEWEKIQSGKNCIIDTGRELANSNGSGRKTNRSIDRMGRVEQSVPGRQSPQGKIKPELGRTINGSANRVDRLRLLGNGVVPQTAAKAYYTLSRKLNAN